MDAYACGSGGVIFVEDKIERALPKVRKVAMRLSNDNTNRKKKPKKRRRKAMK